MAPGSLTPRPPSPTLALPCMPSSPLLRSFLNKQAPTCLLLRASPCYTQARLLLLTPSHALEHSRIPMPAHSLASAPTAAGFTHSTRTWITKLIPGHPSNPSACLATPVVLSPPRAQCTLHSSPCHECGHPLAGPQGHSPHPHRTVLSWALPSSRVSSPAQPNSQNNPCHRGHCHLRAATAELSGPSRARVPSAWCQLSWLTWGK